MRTTRGIFSQAPTRRGRTARHTITADIVHFGDNADGVYSGVEHLRGDTKTIVPQLQKQNKSGEMISEVV